MDVANIYTQLHFGLCPGATFVLKYAFKKILICSMDLAGQILRKLKGNGLRKRVDPTICL